MTTCGSFHSRRNQTLCEPCCSHVTYSRPRDRKEVLRWFANPVTAIPRDVLLLGHTRESCGHSRVSVLPTPGNRDRRPRESFHGELPSLWERTRRRSPLPENYGRRATQRPEFVRAAAHTFHLQDASTEAPTKPATEGSSLSSPWTLPCGANGCLSALPRPASCRSLGPAWQATRRPVSWSLSGCNAGSPKKNRKRRYTTPPSATLIARVKSPLRSEGALSRRPVYLFRIPWLPRPLALQSWRRQVSRGVVPSWIGFSDKRVITLPQRSHTPRACGVRP